MVILFSAKSNVNMKGNLLADIASPLEANEVSLQSELDIDEADSSLLEAICQQADLSTEDLFNFQLQLDQVAIKNMFITSFVAKSEMG